MQARIPTIPSKLVGAMAVALGLVPAAAAHATVHASFENTVFAVSGQAADAIAITCASGEVRVNGSQLTAQPVACESVKRISVTGGSGDNVIDLSGVLLADFRGLPARVAGVRPVTVDGVEGDDTITGSEASDELLGFDGADTIRGGRNRDAIFGEAGSDVLEGGSEDDTIVDRVGDNTLDGGPGHDELTGGLGIDVLDGGDGIDSLQGGQASDVLRGGAGNDRLAGDPNAVSSLGDGFNQAGDDRLDGGAGLDTVLAVNSADTDALRLVLTDTTLKGPGTDSLTSIEAAELTGGGGFDTIDASASTMPTRLHGAAGSDRLIGGSGADILDGQGGNDTLTGNAGDDIFRDPQNTDEVVETGAASFRLSVDRLVGRGTDQLEGIEVVRLLGGDAADTFDATGFTGSALLEGAGGADTLTGGSGADTLAGGDGDDTLSGGPGGDTVEERGDVSFTLTDASLAGRGTDGLAGIEAAHLVGGASANVIDASAFGGAATLDGRAGPDVITGGSGPDTLTGGEGDDALAGGGGADRLLETGDADLTLSDTALTGRGADTLASIESAALTGGGAANTIDAASFSGVASIDGGEGDDVITGGIAGDRLAGGGGDDTISGRGGTDTATGGEGADRLLGGAGADDLAGGFGDDLLLGGNGADALDGGAGNDRLDGEAGDDELAGGADADDLRGADGIDTMAGGEADDSLAGGPGGDRLNGDNGSDTLDGGDGNDYVAGDGGDDRLEGGAGIDVFTGDDGNDALFTRDGVAEPLITCGAGDDAVVPDPGDTVQANCERVEGRPPAAGGLPMAGAVTPRDARPPRLRMSLSPRSFSAHRSGSSLRTRSGRRGARLRYVLDEAATITVRVQRLVAGRRRGSPCVPRTRLDRSARRCTRRLAQRGAVRLSGKPGTSRTGFSGRFGGRTLAAGRYRLVARAVDAAGNVSRPVTLTFRIVR